MKIPSSSEWKEVEEYKMKREMSEKEQVSKKVVGYRWPLTLVLVSIGVSISLVLFKCVALDLILEQQVYQ
ncbi:unnamed protein product, partial [Allacma fusca]